MQSTDSFELSHVPGAAGWRLLGARRGADSFVLGAFFWGELASFVERLRWFERIFEV